MDVPSTIGDDGIAISLRRQIGEYKWKPSQFQDETNREAGFVAIPHLTTRGWLQN